MGQANSIEDPALKAAVQKLSKVELKDLENVYLELCTLQPGNETSGIQQPTWLNRDHFAKIFGTNEFLIEQFFEAFDKDKNGVIDMQEFICGMALCLHGSIKAKCALLFKVFNLDGDEGVSPEELTTMLTSCLQSAQSLLRQTLQTEKLAFTDEDLESQAGEAMVVSVLVDRLVKDAFAKCDVSGNGKLEIDEFEHWVHKNPKLMNNLFVLQCPKPSFQLDPSDEYSVIENEGERLTNPQEDSDIFHDASENLASNNKSQLQSLFGNQGGTAGGDSFFDTLGYDNSQETKALPRPQSDQCIAEHFKEDGAKHGISENDLPSLPLKSFNLSENDTSQSLQSIALSRDSLLAEDQSSQQYKDNSSEASIQSQQSSTDVSLPQTSNGSTEQIWHPLQAAKESSSNSEENDEESVKSSSISNDQLSSDQSVELANHPEVEATASPLEPAMSESTRRMVTYWPPSYKTRQLLQNSSQGHPVEGKYLTIPSVLVEGTMGDPLKELVFKYLGEQEASKRDFPLPHQVAFTEDGLRDLLRAGCWRGAIDFTSKYLAAHGQGLDDVENSNRLIRGMTPALMQIWFVRIALLIKMKMYSSAEAEMNAFNDFEGPDLCYEFYPHLYNGRKGSMVPFGLRLLYAELPQHNGRPNVALDRLYVLKRKVQEVIANLEKGLLQDGSQNDETFSDVELKGCLELWAKRRIQIEYSLGNCFLGMKEYNLAARIYEGIIEIQPSLQASIYSAVGRIYLQIGDINTASQYFEKATSSKADDNTHILMNEGYLELANGNYEDAYQKFTLVLSANPTHVSCINNAAVCLLFLGKLKEASTMLEKLVWQSPTTALHEDVLLNLNTIYELESSRALQKKQKLLHLVSSHKGDGFSTQCLKLT